jgi:hypothetical protein
MILLPQPPECWEYKCEPPFLAYSILQSFKKFYLFLTVNHFYSKEHSSIGTLKYNFM